MLAIIKGKKVRQVKTVPVQIKCGFDPTIARNGAFLHSKKSAKMERFEILDYSRKSIETITPF